MLFVMATIVLILVFLVKTQIYFAIILICGFGLGNAFGNQIAIHLAKKNGWVK